MSRVATLISLLLLLAVPRALSGQNPAPERDTASEPAVVSEKSPFAAGAIEWVVPTAGYAYAGDWARGIPPALVRVVGTALFIEGYELGLFGSESSCDGSCLAGLLMAAGGTMWAVGDAAATARRTNERLREEALSRVSISPVRGPDGTGMRIGMRLPVGR